VNAVVELRPEKALREAAAADDAIARGSGGPLQGVPMTVKDSFNVAGLHTTWATRRSRTTWRTRMRRWCNG
jgi:amidase